jgi:hypothetical protein
MQSFLSLAVDGEDAHIDAPVPLTARYGAIGRFWGGTRKQRTNAAQRNEGQTPPDNADAKLFFFCSQPPSDYGYWIQF